MVEPKHAIVVTVKQNVMVRDINGRSLRQRIYPADFSKAKAVAQGHPYLWITRKPISRRSIKVKITEESFLIPLYAISDNRVAGEIGEYRSAFICTSVQAALTEDGHTPAWARVLYVTPRKRGWRKA
jgi:hypothetical protein